MNEKQLSIICIIIILSGFVLFVFSYKSDFKQTTSFEMGVDESGILFGKIDQIIKNSPSTIFIFNDGNKFLAYYPKETSLARNDFITIYAKKQLYQDKEELYVYKVIEE
jgi:hypothetical protein